jgi:hypothetical protein
MPGACPADGQPVDSNMDVNALVAGYLRDLAYVQTVRAKMFGYKRAASAVFQLEQSLAELLDASGALPRIAGIGPGSSRVIHEVLDGGTSPTVERAIDDAGGRPDIARRRALRQHVLSRAEVLRIIAVDPAGVARPDEDLARRGVPAISRIEPRR